MRNCLRKCLRKCILLFLPAGSFVLPLVLFGLIGCASSPYQSYNKGVEFMISGYPKEAETAFLDEVAEHPNNAEAWNQLGIIAFEQQNYEVAKVRFNRAIELDPLNGNYPRNLALVHAEQKNYETAHELLQRSIEINPSDPQTHLTQAKVYLLQDRTESALQSLEKTLRLDPANEVAMRLQERLNP